MPGLAGHILLGAGLPHKPAETGPGNSTDQRFHQRRRLWLPAEMGHQEGSREIRAGGRRKQLGEVSLLGPSPGGSGMEAPPGLLPAAPGQLPGCGRQAPLTPGQPGPPRPVDISPEAPAFPVLESELAPLSARPPGQRSPRLPAPALHWHWPKALPTPWVLVLLLVASSPLLPPTPGERGLLCAPGGLATPPATPPRAPVLHPVWSWHLPGASVGVLTDPGGTAGALGASGVCCGREALAEGAA